MSELMTMNAADLAKLQGMANEQNLDNAGPRIPIVKLNHDPDAKTPRGVWVMGQEKDDKGVITNEGRKIVGFIVLDVVRRFNHFNQNNKEENCSSKMYVQGESVRGSKHGYVCGNTCPFRDKSRNPHCKAQLVPFGMAVTEDNELVFARMYIQGDTYMPFSEGLEAARAYRTGDGKLYTLPTYAFMLTLGSEKKVNGGNTYFAGRFERGPLFSMEQIEKFAAQLDKTQSVIDELNAAWDRIGKDKPKGDVKTHAAPASAPAAPSFGETVIDVTPHVKTMTKMDDAPFDTKPEPVKATSAMDASSFSIESAIAKALENV